MEIGMDSLQQREDRLTVVRGCVGTVIAHWDRLGDGMRRTLLDTAMDKIEDLVRNLEDDLAPGRRSAFRDAATVDLTGSTASSK